MKFYMLILALAFTTLSLRIYADFHLKGLTSEVHPVNELLVAPLHMENPENDSVAIVNKIPPRDASQMWGEGMAVNSADEQIYNDSVYINQFYNSINKRLVSGDILTTVGTLNDINPKRPRILAANKSTSTNSQSETPHSTLKTLPKRNVVSSTLEAEKKSTTEKLTAEQEETRRRYRSKIWELVLRYLEYPQRAQRRGQEGTVRLSVVIDRSGRIIKLIFLEQSQYHLLNQAVTRAAKRANPFPPVPDELEGVEFVFDMPFTFHVK